MEKREPVLSMRDLAVSFQASFGKIRAVRGVNMDVYPGETVAIVGESGSGKSVSVKTIMGITAPNAVIESGTIKFRFKENGKEQVVDLLKLSKKEMQHRIKGKRIAMVFQDPMTSLDPTMTIGRQLTEGMRYHLHLSQADADKRAEELLEMVGIESPKERMKNYPHQLSGGMRQRVVIAIALSCNPDLLICDEPTTALDVTIQARILQLILNLQKKLGIAVIFITHNLGVVAKIADYVNVMYAGKVVETGKAEDIFFDPRHPYTWGLLSALPAFADKGQTLQSIPGTPPTMIDLPKGDAFAVRNKYAMKIDYEKMPPMFQISPTHYAATWLLDSRAPIVHPPREVLRYTSEIGEEGY